MNPSPKSAPMLLEIRVIFNFYLYKLDLYKIAQNISFLKVIYRKKYYRNTQNREVTSEYVYFKTYAFEVPLSCKATSLANYAFLAI